MYKSLFALSTLAVTNAYVSKNKCPTGYPVVENFDASQYVGTWYEIEKDKDFPIEWGASCNTATYTANPDGTIGVDNRAFYWWWLYNYHSALGSAKCDGAHCTVDFGYGPPPTVPNYNVLKTDYKTYAAVYSCEDMVDGLTVQLTWVLSRTPTLDAATYQEIKTYIEETIPTYSTEAAWSNAEMTKQKNCKY